MRILKNECSIQDNKIIDINSIKININDTKENKILSYINQVKNPYCYKYKGFDVHISYIEDNANEKIEENNIHTLQELLEIYIKNL